MKIILLAVLLLSPIAAWATAPEDAYVAARDRYLAEFKRTVDTKAVEARNNRETLAKKALERRLRAIIGPFAMKGFPAAGKINLDTLFSEDEGFGMLDGLVYGETESARSVVVTTDGLLDKWLRGHGEWWEKDNPSANAPAAVKSESFYTQAVSTDSAVVHLGEIPLPPLAGARFAHATLSARTQDASPSAPDMMFVAVSRGGRVFIVNEKLATPFRPIAACDAIVKDYAKKADAAYEADRAAGDRDPKSPDPSEKLRADGDAAFRQCFGEKMKAEASFKAAVNQARAIVEALPAK